MEYLRPIAHQTANDRLDESLGRRRGPQGNFNQSLASRRNESIGVPLNRYGEPPPPYLPPQLTQSTQSTQSTQPTGPTSTQGAYASPESQADYKANLLAFAAANNIRRDDNDPNQVNADALGVTLDAYNGYLTDISAQGGGRTHSSANYSWGPDDYATSQGAYAGPAVTSTGAAPTGTSTEAAVQAALSSLPITLNSGASFSYPFSLPEPTQAAIDAAIVAAGGAGITTNGDPLVTGAGVPPIPTISWNADGTLTSESNQDIFDYVAAGRNDPSSPAYGLTVSQFYEKYYSTPAGTGTTGGVDAGTGTGTTGGVDAKGTGTGTGTTGGVDAGTGTTGGGVDPGITGGTTDGGVDPGITGGTTDGGVDPTPDIQTLINNWLDSFTTDPNAQDAARQQAINQAAAMTGQYTLTGPSIGYNPYESGQYASSPYGTAGVPDMGGITTIPVPDTYSYKAPGTT